MEQQHAVHKHIDISTKRVKKAYYFMAVRPDLFIHNNNARCLPSSKYPEDSWCQITETNFQQRCFGKIMISSMFTLIFCCCLFFLFFFFDSKMPAIVTYSYEV